MASRHSTNKTTRLLRLAPRCPASSLVVDEVAIKQLTQENCEHRTYSLLVLYTCSYCYMVQGRQHPCVMRDPIVGHLLRKIVSIGCTQHLYLYCIHVGTTLHSNVTWYRVVTTPCKPDSRPLYIKLEISCFTPCACMCKR